MMTTMSPSKFSTPIVAAAVIFCIGGIGAAAAQPMPNTENGHYSLSPVADGVIRLDTRTGAVSTCNNTGYKGRIGLYEVMEVTDEVRELILIGASALELRKKAIEDGMITLRESGLYKIRAGVTTIEEVVRETVA